MGNRAPVAPDVSMSLRAGGTLSLASGASDPDDDAVVYAITAQPTAGKLVINDAGELTYTHPPAVAYGSFTATYSVTDPEALSAEGAVTINVHYDLPSTPSTDLPALARSITTAAAQPLAWQLSSSDADSNPITFSLVDQPSLGTATITNATLTYMPAADAAPGTDSFSVIASSAYDSSAALAFSVLVLDPNQASVESQNATGVIAGGSSSTSLVFSNPDDDTVTWSIVSDPAHGSADIDAAGVLTYTHTTTTVGVIDELTVRITDSLGSNDGLVRVQITNTLPVAAAQDQQGRTGSTLPITLSGSDDDGHDLSYEIVAMPTLGSLGQLSADQITYTAPASAGADSFTYRAFDGYEYGPEATVSIAVRDNLAPVISSPTETDVINVTAGSSTDFTVSASDEDGDTVSLAVQTAPTRGSLSFSGSTATYVHSATAGIGSDTAVITASDGQAHDELTISFNVINSIPVATNKTATVAPGASVTITLSGTDANGHSLNYAIASQPVSGMLSAITEDQVTFTAAADTSGTITFTYTASDQWSTSGPATVTITINKPFEQLILADELDRTTDLQAHDLDLDGDLDLVVFDAVDSQILVYENIDSAAAWRVHRVLNNSNTVRIDYLSTMQLAVGDLNDDTFPDIVFSTRANRVLYIPNNGTMNTWGETQVIADDLYISSYVAVSIGDYNNDGALDVASAANPGWSNASGMHVFLNGGSGSSWTQYVLDSDQGFVDNAWCLESADIDGDQDIDLMLVDSGNDRVAYYANGGDGTTWTRSIIGSDLAGVMDVSLFDFDGDGDLDAACGVSEEDRVALLINPANPAADIPDYDSSGSWTAAELASGLDGAGRLEWIDIDGDSDMDIILAAEHADEHVLLRNDGSFAFTTESITDGDNAWSFVLADIDGDPATINMVYGFWNANGLYHTTTSGDAQAWAGQAPIAPTLSVPGGVRAGTLAGHSPSLAVIDADGSSDIWTMDIVQDEKGDLGGSALLAAEEDPDSSDLALIDLDGDGTMDIFNGSHAHAFDGAEWQSTAVGNYSDSSVSPINIDGDGDMDAVAIGYRALRLYRNETGVMSLLTTIDQDGKYGQCVAVADLNADGRDDLIVGTDTAVLVYTQPELATDIWAVSTIASGLNNVSAIVPINLDADPLVEIAVVSTGDNQVSVYDKSLLWTSTNIDSEASAPVDAVWQDVDSDGDMDLVVLQQGADRIVWYENGNDWALSLVAVGLDGLKHATGADVDQDGVEDLVITRDAAYQDGAVEAYLNRVSGTGPTGTDGDS